MLYDDEGMTNLSPNSLAISSMITGTSPVTPAHHVEPVSCWSVLVHSSAVKQVEKGVRLDNTGKDVRTSTGYVQNLAERQVAVGQWLSHPVWAVLRLRTYPNPQ
jgi:hypothetical protein